MASGADVHVKNVCEFNMEDVGEIEWFQSEFCDVNVYYFEALASLGNFGVFKERKGFEKIFEITFADDY